MGFGEMFRRARAEITPKGQAVKQLYEQNKEATVEKEQDLIEDIEDRQIEILTTRTEKLFARIDEEDSVGSDKHSINILDVLPELQALWKEAEDTPANHTQTPDFDLKEMAGLRTTAEIAINKLDQHQRKFSLANDGTLSWEGSASEK